MSSTRHASRLSASERPIRLAEVDTRVLEIVGDGPPLLFLHGFADSADTWRPLMRILAEAGRGGAAIDLTGFGTAGMLIPEKPLLPQWDRLVAEAIGHVSAAHGGAEVIVVGNSLGGALALRAAESDDLPVAGIVPIAPAGLHMARWFPVIESAQLIRLLRFSPVPVPEAVVRQVVGRVYRELAFHDQAGADRNVIATFSGHIGTIDRGMDVLDIGRRLLPELESPFELKRIDCPLLLVWGERDRMVYTAGAERVLRTVDYSDIEVIADCGHCPQVEMPERLVELLLDFPQSLE